MSKKPPVPTKRGTVSLIKVISCNALWRMLVTCTCNYLKSLLSYNFLMFDSCHLDTPYLCGQWCKHPWLFLKARRGPHAKLLGNTALDPLFSTFVLSPQLIKKKTLYFSFRALPTTVSQHSTKKCTLFFRIYLYYNIIVTIPTCFIPQGIIFKELMSNNVAYYLTVLTPC